MSRRNPRPAARPLPIPPPRRPPPTGPSPAAIQQAWDLFGRGDRTQAESLARAILAQQTDHAGALTLLGIIMAQARRIEEAADVFGRAATRLPNEPTAHNNYGNALRELGKHLSALRCYDRALALKPDYVEAHFNRGLTLHDLRRHEDALASYDRALTLKPGYAAAWNNRGTACRALGRIEEALCSYGRAIAERPDHAEAHNNRGVVLHELGRFEEALASFDAALSLRPDYAETLNNRGAVLLSLERFEEALASFERSLALTPANAEAHNNRGVVLHYLERFDDALASFERALAASPEYAEARSNRGLTLAALKRFEEALASYRLALDANPGCVSAHRNQGATLQELQRFHEALESYERALALKRESSTYQNQGAVLHELKRSEEAIASYQRALAIEPDAKFLRGSYLHTQMQICDWSELETGLAEVTGGLEHGHAVARPFVVQSLVDSPSLQRKAAEIWAREKCSPRDLLTPISPYPRHDRIRVAYFSADFRNHALAALTAELFESHDRSRFDLTAFSLGADVKDSFRSRIEPAFDRFVPVATLTDREIAGMARHLEIDIAVDLGGYTRNARPRILALRAAPIQVNYLGYLGTMGATFMDYLIADPIIVPPEHRPHYSEQIAYLPSYQVNDSKRAISNRVFTRAELRLPEAGFVFCCFNASYKINPVVFASWMRILTAVPGSVMLLLGSSAYVERNLRQHAASAGVDPHRLIFGGALPVADYLARYRAADLFLDTSPYNAGTTASDALWAGLPVLTCIGEAFPARVAASVLTSAGLPELVASSRSEYERLAVEFATRPECLAGIRRKLQENRSTTPLFDTPAFARNLEVLYERMYSRHRSGLAPQHLLLAPSGLTPDESESPHLARVAHA
jgi:protein O-GlcNAc transferase